MSPSTPLLALLAAGVATYLLWPVIRSDVQRLLEEQGFKRADGKGRQYGGGMRMRKTPFPKSTKK